MWGQLGLTTSQIVIALKHAELYKIWLRDYQDKELPVDFDAERTANIAVKSTMHDWLVVNSERFGYLYRFKDI